jgi:ferritin-like metal-binding protein YciE
MYIQKGEVMRSKIPKNFRFTQDTVDRLEELVQQSGKNCTEIIEDTIKYMHGEYRRALKDMEHNEVMMSQIMGTVRKEQL